MGGVQIKLIIDRQLQFLSLSFFFFRILVSKAVHATRNVLSNVARNKTDTIDINKHVLVNNKTSRLQKQIT